MERKKMMGDGKLTEFVIWSEWFLFSETEPESEETLWVPKNRSSNKGINKPKKGLKSICKE